VRNLNKESTVRAAIDFYFDFSSPYGYIAAAKIDALAAKHGRGVNWRPMLLGAAMKVTGGAPLPQIPLKGVYAKRDFVRSAQFHGVPFRIPSSFPISTIAAVRAFYSSHFFWFPPQHWRRWPRHWAPPGSSGSSGTRP
jgi:2-hydroxychromene-2-carboxylate isomerase